MAEAIESMELEAVESPRTAEDLETQDRSFQSEVVISGKDDRPLLPEVCPMERGSRADPRVDIPARFRATVRAVEALWMANLVLLVIDMCGNVALYYHDVSTADQPIYDLIAMVLSPGLAFVGWLRPIHRAFRNESSLNLLMFEIFFSFHLASSSVYAIGFRGCGIRAAFVAFWGGTSLGVSISLIAVLHILYLIAVMILRERMHSHYEACPWASCLNARAEFATLICHDDRMKDAAVSILAGTVSRPKTWTKYPVCQLVRSLRIRLKLLASTPKYLREES